MINPRYVLIVRDGQERRLTVVSTHREPRTGTRHNGISPSFLRFCRSIFALYPQATSVETVSLEGWTTGVDVGTLHPVLWVEMQDNKLVCNLPLEEKAS